MCSADNKPEFWPSRRKPGPGAGQPLAVGKGTQIPQGEGLGRSRERMEVQPVLWHPLKCCCSVIWGEWGAAEPKPAVCQGLLCFHMSLSLKSLPCVALL